jgi:hypothetical protein
VEQRTKVGDQLESREAKGLMILPNVLARADKVIK